MFRPVTGLRFPWDSDPPVAEPQLRLPAGRLPAGRLSAVPCAPKRRGRRPKAAARAAPSADPAWLYHHLTITGPAAKVADFAVAARGAGVIPWRFDTAAAEEDVFNLAASQPPYLRRLSIEGCRRLARQLRDRMEARAAQAILLSETSQACPFDLHRLLPVPPTILLLGPSAPQSLAWLEKHWGISGRLFQVAARPDAKPGRRLGHGEACLGFGFFALAATPHTAIAQIAASWPELRFVLRARPAE